VSVLRVQSVAGVAGFAAAFPNLGTQQSVLPTTTRVGILRQPGHDDQVRVQTDRRGHRADEDSLTEPADPGQRGLQFQQEQVGQSLRLGGDAEVVEPDNPCRIRSIAAAAYCSSAGNRPRSTAWPKMS